MMRLSTLAYLPNYLAYTLSDAGFAYAVEFPASSGNREKTMAIKHDKNVAGIPSSELEDCGKVSGKVSGLFFDRNK